MGDEEREKGEWLLDGGVKGIAPGALHSQAVIHRDKEMKQFI